MRAAGERAACDGGAAITVIRALLTATDPDAAHSLDEERFVIFGVSAGGRVRTVVHTEWVGRLRIVSAGAAPPRAGRP